jgi:hypothetical protein
VIVPASVVGSVVTAVTVRFSPPARATWMSFVPMLAALTAWSSVYVTVTVAVAAPAAGGAAATAAVGAVPTGGGLIPVGFSRNPRCCPFSSPTPTICPLSFTLLASTSVHPVPPSIIAFRSCIDPAVWTTARWSFRSWSLAEYPTTTPLLLMSFATPTLSPDSVPRLVIDEPLNRNARLVVTLFASRPDVPTICPSSLIP